jgi:glycosyltransferase involved in cell wall biosynthesis
VGQVVVVVDDRTRDEDARAVESMGTELVSFTWIDDFSSARKVALPYCHGDWILHLDPDELPSAAMLAFLAMVDRSEWRASTEWESNVYPDPRGYLFLARGYIDGQRGAEVEPDWHCRLFRRDRGTWYKPLHEQVALEGRSESETRGTPWLPKAPRAAYFIHSKASGQQDADLALYARMEASHAV